MRPRFVDTRDTSPIVTPVYIILDYKLCWIDGLIKVMTNSVSERTSTTDAFTLINFRSSYTKTGYSCINSEYFVFT